MHHHSSFSACYPNHCSEVNSYVTSGARTMFTNCHTELALVRDYVNTFDLETGIDSIATPDELAMWFSEQGLVDDLVEPTEEEVADALAVREAIRELLLANNGVETDAAAASKTLEEAGRKADLGVRVEN